MRQLQAHPLHRGDAGLSAPPDGGFPSTPADRLAAIRRRIAAACGRSGRDPATVELVGASKTRPAQTLAAFISAGLRLLGENRVQEAAAKQRELARLGAAAAPGAPPGTSPVTPPEWHLIGPLQSNKVRQALDLFSCLHALDPRRSPRPWTARRRGAASR